MFITAKLKWEMLVNTINQWIKSVLIREIGGNSIKWYFSEWTQWYNHNIPEKYLFEIKLMLSDFFAQKVSEAMDNFCNENKVTE